MPAGTSLLRMFEPLSIAGLIRRKTEPSQEEGLLIDPCRIGGAVIISCVDGHHGHAVRKKAKRTTGFQQLRRRVPEYPIIVPGGVATLQQLGPISGQIFDSTFRLWTWLDLQVALLRRMCQLEDQQILILANSHDGCLDGGEHCQNNAEKAIRSIKKQYPAMQVIGLHHHVGGVVDGDYMHGGHRVTVIRP